MSGPTGGPTDYHPDPDESGISISKRLNLLRPAAYPASYMSDSSPICRCLQHVFETSNCSFQYVASPSISYFGIS